MGRVEPLELGKEFLLQLPSPLTVFAASEHIDALKAAQGSSWIGDATLRALPLNAEIPAEEISPGRITIVQIDADVPESLERVRKLRSHRPDLVQIAAIANADVRLVRALVREGVADVVGLPLDPQEILQAAIAVMEVAAAKTDLETRSAPMIAVTRATGGGGATTVATHLAHQLVEDAGGNATCCIIDLDIQYGRVAEVLGLRPRRTLIDLLDAGDRLDGAIIRSVATDGPGRVKVIAAPLEIVPLESIDTGRLQLAIDVARKEFDFVVLDMPSNLTNWSLTLLARADSIVLLCQQSLASLRQARRRLDLFRSVGIDLKNVSLVVNQTERRLFGGIGLNDVAHATGHQVAHTLALDVQTVSAAQDQGILANQLRPKSAFVSDIRKLTQLLDAHLTSRRLL